MVPVNIEPGKLSAVLIGLTNKIVNFLYFSWSVLKISFYMYFVTKYRFHDQCSGSASVFLIYAALTSQHEFYTMSSLRTYGISFYIHSYLCNDVQSVTH